jgi:hypothetical protein
VVLNCRFLAPIGLAYLARFQDHDHAVFFTTKGVTFLPENYALDITEYGTPFDFCLSPDKDKVSVLTERGVVDIDID